MATTDDLVIINTGGCRTLESQLRNIDQQFEAIQRVKATRLQVLLKHGIAVLSLGAAIEGMKKLVDVNRNFGILKAGLETATGSLDGANQAFAALQQFAQTTPYSLQQAVDGFTKLVNLGLTPSEEALKVTVTQARH